MLLALCPLLQVHLAEYHGKAVAVKKLMGGARVGSPLPLSHPELAQLRNVSLQRGCVISWLAGWLAGLAGCRAGDARGWPWRLLG